MKSKIHLSLTSQTCDGKAVRSVLKSLMDLVDWDEESQFRVLLIADEAVQNAVDAGNKLAVETLIEIEIKITDGRFDLMVENSGSWQLVQEQPLSRRSLLRRYQGVSLEERGRGLAIMAEYSERMSIRINAAGRIVTRISLRCKSAGREELE